MQEEKTLNSDPVVNLPAELLIEVAVGIGTLENICLKYGYSVKQIDFLRGDERFKALVARTEANLMKEEKLHELRSAYTADVALRILHQRVTDPSLSTGQVLEIYRETVKNGNLLPKPNLSQSVGSGYSITINIPQVGETPGRTIEMNRSDEDPVTLEAKPVAGPLLDVNRKVNRKLNSSLELPEDYCDE